MAISITDDIRSISELKRNAAQILRQVHKSGRPVVLTVRGKVEAVLMEAKEYERTANALAMLKLILPAEEDVKKARTRAASTFFKELKRDKGIQR
jgi:prevent-host-death family protein